MNNPLIEWLLSVIGPVLAVYSFLKAQTTRQENRITMLEQQTGFFKTQLELERFQLVATINDKDKEIANLKAEIEKLKADNVDNESEE